MWSAGRWLLVCNCSLRGPEGGARSMARNCLRDLFSHVFQVSFPTAFRTSIFRDLGSQDPDLGPKMTSKSEPGGTPETTKN